ncbi:hypothetical protein QZH41_006534 [Actinostola sp. cb2023]|nr:hypothetical protein QZH41_006534 [Actinostola sp. cb2023]
MAAAKAKFTVEDVLEEVVTEPGVEGNEEDVPSLAEVLKSSVQEFYPLRSTVDSFTAFRDEAMQALEGVYRNHRVGLLDDSEKILDKPVNVRPAIAAEIMLWLKSIYRRMTGSPRAQNPCDSNGVTTITRWPDSPVYSSKTKASYPSYPRLTLLQKQEYRQQWLLLLLDLLEPCQFFFGILQVPVKGQRAFAASDIFPREC